MAAQNIPIEKSIAVLPFVDHSQEPESAYFSEGISEEITNALAQLPGLRVAARTSSFSFKDGDRDPRAVAARLNVGAVLEGSVLRVDDRVRVTARLFDAAGGKQIWSEQYDRDLAGLFAVQKEITAAIARCLRVTLPVGQERRLRRPAPDHPEVFDLYLKGRFVMEHRGERNLRRAIEYFEQATAADPEYAPAHTGIANALAFLSLYGFERPHEVMPRARAAAERAVDRDQGLADAHAALAFILSSYAWDWEGVEREYLRALALNPNHVTALAHYGFYHLICIEDRIDEGLELIQSALDVDPLATMPVAVMGAAAYYTGRGEQFLDQIREGVEGHPSLWLLHRALGFALAGLERHPEAIEALEKAVKLSGRYHWTLIDLGVARAAAGDREGALEIHRELTALSEASYLQPFSLAAIPAALGQTEEALGALETTFKERDGILNVVRHYPAFRSLHGDPRFQAILRGMGLRSAPPR